jgi:hypothetical protein
MVLGFHKADLESEKDLAEFSELLELNEALAGREALAEFFKYLGRHWARLQHPANRLCLPLRLAVADSDVDPHRYRSGLLARRT